MPLASEARCGARCLWCSRCWQLASRGVCGASGPSTLVSLSGHTVTVGSPPRPLVTGLDLTIRDGERWAIVGPNGCGKSVTAQLLMQKFAGHSGQGAMRCRQNWNAWERLEPPRDSLYISFESHRQLLQRELHDFRESRFEVVHKRATVASFLFPELYPSDPAYPQGYDGYRPPRTRLAPLPVPYDALAGHPALVALEEAVCSGEAGRLLADFGLHCVRHEPIYGLSTGQVRKMVLAHGLLSSPRLLVLDEAFDGLDAASRGVVSAALARGGADGRGAVVMIAHRDQDVALEPTHALVLGEGTCGTAYVAGPWSDVRLAAAAALAHTECDVLPPGLPAVKGDGFSGDGTTELGPPIVELRDVTIRYGERTVLNRLSWIIREGENWAVIGGNGAGKSTLIELITGDNLLAYTQDIFLFGRKRGSGESIWDIKRQMGLISTEFHCEYADWADPSNQWYNRTHPGITTWEVVCSGFFDSIGLYQEVGASLEAQARRWVERLGLQDLVAVPESRRQGFRSAAKEQCQDFALLSFGQQKLVLVCRAMVKQPRLLLFDEPTQGLSGDNRKRLLGMLASLAANRKVAIILVSHRQEEIDALGFENILRL